MIDRPKAKTDRIAFAPLISLTCSRGDYGINFRSWIRTDGAAFRSRELSRQSKLWRETQIKRTLRARYDSGSGGALIFFLSTYSAFAAETTWDVLQRFGLAGVWAASCHHPSTRTNFRTIFSKDASGLARREVDRGAEIPIALSFVDSAQIISSSTLRIRVRNADPNWGPANNLTYDVVLTKEDDPETKEIFRIRFLQSIQSDGMVIAKDGILIKLGKPTYWVYKCRSAMSEVS